MLVLAKYFGVTVNVCFDSKPLVFSRYLLLV